MNETKAKKIGFITLVGISTLVIVSIFFLFICGINFNQNKKEPTISEKEEEETIKKEEEEKKTLYYLEF